MSSLYVCMLQVSTINVEGVEYMSPQMYKNDGTIIAGNESGCILIKQQGAGEK